MLKDKLDALLRLKGKNMNSFCSDRNYTQANLSKKGKTNSFYLKEAVEIADYANVRLAFVDESGNIVVSFNMEDIKKDTE